MTTSTTPTCADCGQSTGEIIHGQLSGQTFHEDVTDCNEALKLALAAATQENAKLVEKIAKFVTGDIGIKELTVRDGVMNLTLATAMAGDMAQCMATMLDESCDKPAENYVEITCGIPATGKQYTMTIRRHEKPTPHALHVAEKLRADINEQDAARWRAVRAQWLGFDFEYEGNPLQPFVAVFSMPHGFMMMEPIDPDHYADQLVARAGGV